MTIGIVGGIGGSGGIDNGWIEFSTTPEDVPTAAGVMSWNVSERTLDLQQPDNVTLQLGQEIHVMALNNSGSAIPNGSVVYVSGASGDRVTIGLADASDSGKLSTIGVTTQAISNGESGKITFIGLVHGLNTLGMTPGAQIFLSATPGGMTTTAPVSPNARIQIGQVTRADATDGCVLVHIESTLIGLTDLLSAVGYDGGYTGFADPENVVSTYSKTARTITLTHSSGSVIYFWKGRKYSLASGWVSPVHDAIDGKWYLSSQDGLTISWSQTLWSTFRELMVAAVYRNGAHVFGFREHHGLMDAEVHAEFHFTIGTYCRSGGALTPGTYVVGSAVDDDITPGVNSVTICDEDLPTVLPLLPGTNKYVWLEPTGATTLGFTPAQSFPFRSAGSYIQWYSDATLTTGVNNRYYNVYGIAIPVTADADSQAYRWCWLQSQAEFLSEALAKAENFFALNLRDIKAIAVEFFPRVRLTYATASANTTTGKVTLTTPTYLVSSTGATTITP